MNWTLVTGGSKRLGAEICKKLSASGHAVLIHYYKSKKDAEELAAFCQEQGGNAEVIPGDFSSKESTLDFIGKCQREFPDIKNLINNVGNYQIESATHTSLDDWCALFQTNLHAPFALCQSFLPTIKVSKGNIINIGVAGANHIHADVKRTAYLATKMSLLMLTKSLARELAPFHVRVNMVSPGYLENAVDLKEAQLPMGRSVKMDEVVNTILFLLRDDLQSITGQNIEVGGAIGLLS